MAVFDTFAKGYDYWIERANPRVYSGLFDGFLPERAGLALDAGCGPGYLSFYLAGCFERVVGLDISTVMLDLAKERRSRLAASNIDFILADLEQLPFEAGVFDFVASDCVLHDTPLDVTVPNLLRLVRPGGRLVLRDLVTHDLRHSRSAIWQSLRAFRHLPRYVRMHGPSVAIQMVAFESSPTWAVHRSQAERYTPEEYQRVYGILIPGCRFVDYGWSMAALWEAPEEQGST